MSHIEREYRIAKFYAILIYIFGPILIVVFGMILFMPFMPDMHVPTSALFLLAPVSLGMITYTIIGILDAINGKFVITHNSIFLETTLGKRELLYNEIKGYRLTEKHIIIESAVPGKKRIQLSTYFKNTNEIIAWLSTNHYPDLDLTNESLEKETILNDESLGWNQTQREEKLNLARRISKILNWVGGIVGIWAIFWPHPYEYVIVACVTIPVICIFVLKFFNGLIRINEKKGSAYPFVFWGFFAPGMGACLRALFDFNIFSHDSAWTPTIIITACMVAALLIGNKEFHYQKVSDYIVILSFALMSFAYAYGTIITLNCTFDKSQPKFFNAKIEGKRISSGKTTTYYLRLSPWNGQTESDEASVPEAMYNNVNDGDEVTIFFSNGEFGIPWFFIMDTMNF